MDTHTRDSRAFTPTPNHAQVKVTGVMDWALEQGAEELESAQRVWGSGRSALDWDRWEEQPGTPEPL